MKAIKRIDILFLVYLVISTSALILSWDSIANFSLLLLIHGLILAFVVGLIFLSRLINNRLVSLLRDTYPIIFSGYFYSETVFYNKLLMSNIDPLLIKIEQAIFGRQISLVFSQSMNNKLISELMYFSYFSFYLLIAGFVLYLYFNKKTYFQAGVFQLSASLYIFYLLFMIFPSEGPQFYFSSPDSQLPNAYVFNHVMSFIQSVGEQPTGAFPSSHVGISLIILMLSRRKAPVFYKYTCLLVILLMASTVYIKAHYAIDVIGGVIIAPFVLYLSNILYRFPSEKNEKFIKLDVHD